NSIRYEVRWETVPEKAGGEVSKTREGGTDSGAAILLLDFAHRRLRLDQDVLLRFMNNRGRQSRVRSTIRYDGREQSSYLVIDGDAAKAPAELDVKLVFTAPWAQGHVSWLAELSPMLWAHGLIRSSGDTTAGEPAFPLDWKP